MARVPRNLESVPAPEGWLRNPNNADGATPLGYVENVVLTGGAAQLIPVPATATSCTFSSNVDFYVAFITSGSSPTATVPSATTTDGSGLLLNPINVFFGRGEIANFSIIGPDTGIMSISFWGS